MNYEETMMKKIMATKPIALLLLFGLTIFCQGCQKKPETYVSPSTTIRDNTPDCLIPRADGTTVYSNPYVSIDASNLSEGYIMASYLGDCPIVKLQLVGPDYMTYTYDLKGSEYEAFPLSAGNGAYSLNVYENLTGNQYVAVFSQELDVNISNPWGSFLYPNQYVKFDASSRVVSVAKSLVADYYGL